MNFSGGRTNKGGMGTKPSDVRVLEPNRGQLEWQRVDLEGLLPEEHEARAIWAAICRLDLSAFYAEIAARGSDPGRPATDPRVLLVLWIYATSQGIGSARQLCRMCESDNACRWICGGVPVNYHTLSDFRVKHGEKLDALMTQLLTVLMHEEIVTLKRVAQDGMRVRASAGAASFRGKATLERCLEEARQQVAVLRAQLDDDPVEHAQRQRAAQERAAKEREQRLEQALKELPLVEEAKERSRKRSAKKKVSEPRVSTTDPDARTMKMADGGFRPAYNAQFATDVDSRIIVEVDVSKIGSDMALMPPMLDAIKRRTGRLPEEHLVDGGYAGLDAIEKAEKQDVKVLAPPLKRPNGREGKRQRKDSKEVADWRARMETEEGKEIYRLRAATAETVHADLSHWRSLKRFPVRGHDRVRAVVLLNALTYNLRRAIKHFGVLA